jgi:hypothetical protein
MDAIGRSKLQQMHDQLENISNELQDLHTEESDKLENLEPHGSRYAEKGTQIEAVVEAIDDVIDNVELARATLEEILALKTVA